MMAPVDSHGKGNIQQQRRGSDQRNTKDTAALKQFPDSEKHKNGAGHTTDYPQKPQPTASDLLFMMTGYHLLISVFSK